MNIVIAMLIVVATLSVAGADNSTVRPTPAASVPVSATYGEALGILRAKLIADRVYDPWSKKGKCLHFFGEGETKKYFDMVVRERHTPACGGDPRVSPVVDRFRIRRDTGAILWVDHAGEGYFPYKRFRRERLASQRARRAAQPDAAGDTPQAARP